MFRVSSVLVLILSVGVLAAATGCGLTDQIEQLIASGEQAASQLLEQAQQTVDRQLQQNVQTTDPRTTTQPVTAREHDADVVLADDAEFVDDVSEDLSEEDLDSIILVAFDNQTGYDIFLAYAVDGEEQQVYVMADQALLLAYPCFTELWMIGEMDFDPDTGEFVYAYEFSGGFTDPGDFSCGDLFVITSTPEAISGKTESVDLATGAVQSSGEFDGEGSSSDGM